MDLKILQQTLIPANVSFSYFTWEEDRGNYHYRKAVKEAKKYYLQHADVCIGIDESLLFAKKRDCTETSCRKILISLPYTWLRDSSRFFLDANTKLCSISPYTTELLQNKKDIKGGFIIECVQSPTSESLNQHEAADAIKKRWFSYYPQIRGKKIIAFLYSGKAPEINIKKWGWSLDTCLKNLPEDSFLFTNHPAHREQFFDIRYDENLPCAFVGKMLPYRQLLYFCDTLITNDAVLFHYACARKIPAYGLKRSGFEKSLDGKYGKIFLSSGKDLAGIEEKDSAYDKNVWDYFAYHEGISIADLILE